MTNINRARARVTFIAENYAMLQADSMKIRLMLDRTGRHRADIVVGATVECRYTTRFNSRAKGAHDRHLHDVEQVFSVTAPPAPQLAIVQFMHEKGWGKVGVPGVAEQVFLPRSTWVPKGMQPAAGMKMLAVISENADGFFVSSFEESVEIDRQFDEAYPATFTSESEEELVLASFSPVKKAAVKKSKADQPTAELPDGPLAGPLKAIGFNGSAANGVTAH